MTDQTEAKTETKTAETLDAARTEGLEMARKIWLAGVGAYGRVFSEASDRLGKVTGAANEMFDQLVEKGEQVEDLVRSKIATNPTAEKVTETFEKTTATVKETAEKRIHALEEGFEKVRHQVLDTVAPFNVFALGAKIEELTATVAALQAEVEALKAKPAAKAKKVEAEAV